LAALLKGVLIAKKLFVLNNYDPRYPSYRSSRNPPNIGPWNKYQAGVLVFAGAAAWALAAGSVMAVLAVSYALAAIRVALTG
jgi:sorbitol-specific phosphotransferase system component IIC